MGSANLSEIIIGLLRTAAYYLVHLLVILLCQLVMSLSVFQHLCGLIFDLSQACTRVLVWYGCWALLYVFGSDYWEACPWLLLCSLIFFFFFFFPCWLLANRVVGRCVAGLVCWPLFGPTVRVDECCQAVLGFWFQVGLVGGPMVILANW